jgi:hypothetical protein
MEIVALGFRVHMLRGLQLARHAIFVFTHSRDPPSRDTNDYRIISNVLRDNSTGTNYRVVSDSDAWEDTP